jgi:putative Ca2+/H+ antiporter (TMEM165/GDT1 family)
MDWKLLVTTFVTLFLAELGDKTQLVIIGFAGSGKSVWTVFIGATAALATTSLLAVLVGAGLQKILPVKTIHIGSGFLFIIIGIFLVVRNLRG